ncbi:MAG: hypothetical protein LBF83_07490 [Spirochaetaceae bacterium]|jgi:hypothetical protein|nr:hypothetical protein [Spirochaetaceae bacterium]
MWQNVKSGIAFFCILIYIAVAAFAGVKVYEAVNEQRFTAREEFADLTDLASRAGALGLFTDEYIEDLKTQLDMSEALDALIIYGPDDNKFAFEKRAGLISYRDNYPDFNRKARLYRAPQSAPVRTEGSLNVSISAISPLIDFNTLLSILRSSLLAVLAAVSVAFVTLIADVYVAPAGGFAKTGKPDTVGDADYALSADEEETLLADQLAADYHELAADNELTAADEEMPPVDEMAADELAVAGEELLPIDEFAADELAAADEDLLPADEMAAADEELLPVDEMAADELAVAGEELLPADELAADELAAADEELLPADEMAADELAAADEELTADYDEATPTAGWNSDGKKETAGLGLLAAASAMYDADAFGGMGEDLEFSDILQNELSMADANGRDLVLLNIEWTTPGLSCKPLIKQAASLFAEGSRFFEKDGQDGLYIIVPDCSLDEAFAKVKEFHKYAREKKPPEVYAELLIGMTARSLRNVGAINFLNEAEHALEKARLDSALPIVAFKVDLQKYNEYTKRSVAG